MNNNKLTSGIAILVSLFLGNIYSYSQEHCRHLVWSDEFDYSGLPDSTKWAYDIGDGCDYGVCNWGNLEAQYYTYKDLDNARVENGSLIIEARKEPTYNKKYSSARIVTRDILELTHGRVEFSAKLQTGKGTWSALWLLGDRETLGWPLCGEIDVMEYIGVEPGVVRGTVHQQSAYGGEGPSMSINIPDAETEFHTYAIEWNTDSIEWFVDDVKYHVYHNEYSGDEQWPYDKDFYLIINLAIGGTLGGPIDNSIFDDVVAMEVDYIRVYQTIEESYIQGKSSIVNNEGNLSYSTLIPANKYIWTVPASAVITDGEGSSSIEVDWGCEEGTINLEIETDCDTASISKSISFEEMKIEGKELVYQQETPITYSIPEISGGSYNWNVPADAVIHSGESENEIELKWGCDADQINIDINGSCNSTTITKNIDIVKPSIQGSGHLSAWAANIEYSIDSLHPGNISWSFPEGVIVNSGGNSSVVNVDWGAVSDYIIVEIENDCGVIKDSLFINITQDLVLADFDVVNPEFFVFGGSLIESAENPSKTDANQSDLVGLTYKDNSATSWGGIYTDLSENLDFTYGSTFSLQVYAPVTGNVLFKIEDNSGNASPIEISNEITKINEWEEISYTFEDAQNNTYNRFALFFDFGQTRTDTFYFDNVKLVRNNSISAEMTHQDSIIEGSEDGKTIEITLNGDSFVNSLNNENWIFSNLPQGVTVAAINRLSGTEAQLVLGGNSTEDYDEDITNFSVLIKAVELQQSETNLMIDTGVTFTAKIEDNIIKMSNIVKIYPNPVIDVLNISFTTSPSSSFKGSLLDVQGKIIKEFLLYNCSSMEFNLTELESGFYFLLLRGENTIIHKKIIKK